MRICRSNLGWRGRIALLVTLAFILASATRGAEPAAKLPAGWKTYDSTAESDRPDLKSHFVAFSVSYPETFKPKPRQDGIFVDLAKMSPDGKDVAASFTVTWYEADDPNSDKGNEELLQNLGKQWAEKMAKFKSKTVSYTSRKIDGVMGDGGTWEFTTDDTPPIFAAGARSYVVHQPGKTSGVRIDQYGTWLDPKIKSVANVGRDDDLARILATFKFLPDKKTGSVAPSKEQTTPSPSEKMRPEDDQALGAAAMTWLASLDEGDYANTLATASESFRKGMTVEKWKQGHLLMQTGVGRVENRDGAHASLTTRKVEADDGTKTTTLTLKIPTTFTKASGVELVTMTKEAGEWKVADYSIETKVR